MTATEAVGRVELLPDPEPRPEQFTVISVDDHLVEPRDMFEGRLPARFADRAPHVILADDGSEPWVYEDQVLSLNGSNAVVGQVDRSDVAPNNFNDMRKGCWDVDARVADMDINGVWASVNFPSIISGFCGRIFSLSQDRELGLAVTRAWNDWMFEEWHGAYPERLIALAITWLSDPEIGAEEIRRNAARGVTTVTLPEMPHKIGLPSLHTDYWDPILRACQETDTVISLHVGSSGIEKAGPGGPPGLVTTLFPVSSMQACAEWVWSGAALRFPDLKIVMAEGGIGWVPMLIDRLDYVLDHAGGGSHGSWSWTGGDTTPADLVRRNFWFAVLDDPSNLRLRDVIGVDHIMMESDYPHGDSTWPDTQEHFARLLADLSLDEQRLVTHQTAARLFRCPLPAVTRP